MQPLRIEDRTVAFIDGRTLVKKETSQGRFRKMDAHSFPVDIIDNLDDDFQLKIIESDTKLVLDISVVKFRTLAKKMKFNNTEEKYYLPIRYFTKEDQSET